MPTLSIIILSYNTADITLQCLSSLCESLKGSSIQSQIIVVDNNSSDGSQELLLQAQQKLQSFQIEIVIKCNATNEGFPKGNNTGVKEATGNYLLFLNSDVLIQHIQWDELFRYFENNPKTGALTVRVNLPTGSIDPASHRGFPTVWNSFCYYSGLEKFTLYLPGLRTLFGGYHLTQYNLDTQHEIDSPSGAFYLMKKQVFEEVGRFDETFFMYGEDLDLSFRLKEKGYVNIYYPAYHVTHLKYQSGLKKNSTETGVKTKKYFYDAMKIFYKKHYESQYPSFINTIVYFSISVLEKIKSL